MKIKVQEEDIRIDNFLAQKLDQSRSQINKMIKNKQISINGKNIKSGYLIKQNDIIDVNLEDTTTNIVPEKMDLDIVYEDQDVIVVNKANGVVVHPALGHYNKTLVNGLLYHSQTLSDKNGEFRPGIIHRIDANTTGLLMIAKTNKAHEFLAHQLEQKSTHRKYIALVWGNITEDSGSIDAPIGRDPKDRKKMAVVANGKKAITHFKVLERYKKATLIEVILETGRTHQIRVHMNYINHPVVNDNVYGRRKLIDDTGQCLHAKELGFVHPNGKYMEFTSQLPDCFLNILKKFQEGE